MKLASERAWLVFSITPMLCEPVTYAQSTIQYKRKRSGHVIQDTRRMEHVYLICDGVCRIPLDRSSHRTPRVIPFVFSYSQLSSRSNYSQDGVTECNRKSSLTYAK